MGFDDFDEYSDLEQEPSEYSFKKDLILFCLDVSPKMHLPSPNDSLGRSYFQISLAVIISLLESRLSNSNDKIGLLLYGSEFDKRRPSMAPLKHIHLLLDLQVQNVQDITNLKKYFDHDIYSREIGTSENYQLGNVFWAISEVFSKVKLDSFSPRVFFITNNDNPHPKSTQADYARIAINKAKDLKYNSIKLLLFPLSSSTSKDEKTFDFNIFYNNLPGITENDTEEDSPTHDISCNYNDLYGKISFAENVKRFNFKIPFYLAPQVECGIKGIVVISEAKKPTAKKLDMAQNRIVISKTQYIAGHDSCRLDLKELKYAFEYGGDKMKNFGAPGLMLLGFKDSSYLKFKHNIQNSILIIPDEQSYSGSTCLLANLINVMIEKSQVAICRFMARATALVRLVALIPDKDPMGFQMIYLPFADDIRHFDLEIAPILTRKSVDKSLIDSMKNVIESISVQSLPMFKNPDLDLFYSGLRGAALELEEDELVADETLPDYNWITKNAGSFIKEFNQNLDVQFPNQLKREGDDIEGNQKPQKKTRMTLTSDNVKEIHSSGKLNSYTISELTAFLKSCGIKPAKKKPDLIEQTEHYLSQH